MSWRLKNFFQAAKKLPLPKAERRPRQNRPPWLREKLRQPTTSAKRQLKKDQVMNWLQLEIIPTNTLASNLGTKNLFELNREHWQRPLGGLFYLWPCQPEFLTNCYHWKVGCKLNNLVTYTLEDGKQCSFSDYVHLLHSIGFLKKNLIPKICNWHNDLW